MPPNFRPSDPPHPRSTRKPKPPKLASKLLVPQEISWLSFNERVLQEADDPRNSPLERLKFLGIFSNNLDEFYRVRVANLRRIEREEGPKCRIMGVPVRRIIKEVRARVLRHAELFNETSRHVIGELEAAGIRLVDEHHLTEAQTAHVREFFQAEVRPRLVPVICHRTRELPALRDQFIHLAVELILPNRVSPVYAFIEVPTDSLSRFCVLPRENGSDYVILLEDVIRLGLGEMFTPFAPCQHRAWTVKITRDSELELEDDMGEAYVDVVHRGLRKRGIGAPVRMIYDKSLPEPFLRFLLHKMKLQREDDIIPGQRYHNFKDFVRFPDLGREHLRRRGSPPIAQPDLHGKARLFEAIAQRDILLHYPYHSFASLIDFLREAAIDPRVTQICMTVYRVSQNSSVLNALRNAVRNGKQVVVMIELLARFDEQNNLEWVDRLREQGAEVITGVKGLKVHSKLCLVSRREAGGLVRYAVVGTGNFHEDTARIYSDHVLMTSDAEITNEVARVFEFFRNNYKVTSYEHLIVSPFHSRRRWRRLIRKEVQYAKKGKDAYIWVKLNNLSDPKLIMALYAASRSGVQVRLIVRSMFSLVPGVAGVSKNIEAISIVGRYLEHSRFLVFCNGGRPLVYITSGDWMARNLDGRVEVACPIRDPDLSSQLIEYFRLQWEDTANARIWDSDLSNRRRQAGGEGTHSDSHETIRAFLESLARGCGAETAELRAVVSAAPSGRKVNDDGRQVRRVVHSNVA